MSIPTVAALRIAWPNLTDGAAGMIRSLLAGKDTPLMFYSACEWWHACHHRPPLEDPELVLRAVSDIVNECGVECVRVVDRSLWYVNTGQSYGATLTFDTDTGEYRVQSWADWMEANELMTEDD